jgi:hypothetical protein
MAMAQHLSYTCNVRVQAATQLSAAAILTRLLSCPGKRLCHLEPVIPLSKLCIQIASLLLSDHPPVQIETIYIERLRCVRTILYHYFHSTV